ncbi:MAG: DUF255 domain-containing protein [Alphaproteobacteria bacterium]|nr:DUF255 domain-containing protein [Alphaproteobacteria bacterium]
MPNLLARETSPYLLQHADNPVDWRPWGPDALAAAKAENRPVLLSVGYAACHWCHVMAHESFENAEIAGLMNALFVSVKVDREERPDIDTIYQHALMMLGQQGGWPLTMFLTPEGEPFWGGTYFPPESRYGRPGFPDVLRTIDEYWREKQDSIAQNVTALRDALGGMARSAPGGRVDAATVDRAAMRIAEEVDMVHGGIGTAPKFPQPSVLALMWRSWKRTGETRPRDAVLLTLDRMSEGGIYDHLGGGYARYSTDAVWLAPHFEKMLYDNAQLIDLLCWAWQDTGDALFETRLRETVGWVLREMIAGDGGFAATLDADSEGEEGRYYVWTAEEIDALLGDGADLFKRVYDVHPGGNWEGSTILNRTRWTGSLSEAEAAALARAREILFAARETRVRPGWDDKVLADWNGLTIAALAHAGAVFGEREWIAAAVRAYRFVTGPMMAEGRLLHAARNGDARHAATCDDYANMIRAALALFEAEGGEGYLDDARGFAATLDAHYRDEAGGGYFFTADDAEALIVRTKSADDHATPAGNGTLVEALARLWLLTGEDEYRARAEEIVTAFSGAVEKNFFPLTTLMNGAAFLETARQIVVAGARGEAETDALVAAAFRAAPPDRTIAVAADDATLPAGHPARGKGRVDGAAAAYVCVGQSCSLPLTDPAALADSLRH